MVEKKVLIVEDRFLLKQRGGLVVAGWIEKDSAALSLGNAVRIVRPDGTAIETTVSGIESFINRKCFSETSNGENRAFLLKDLTNEDIPKGSVVFLIEK